MASHGSKRVVVFALLANAGIACAKFVAAFLTGSAAMLAEAVHSCADTGNQVLLLVGMSRAKRPPSETHPFGYAMESYFWSFLVAVMLFSLGGLFSIYEGLHKLEEVHEPAEHGGGYFAVAIAVLLVSIVLEGISWWVATKEVNRHRGKLGLLRYIEESKSPEIIVVWMEDTGAMIGLFLALVGVSLTALTGNPLYDALGSLAIGCLLVVIAVVVGREVKSLLIGEAALPETRETIRRVVESTPGVGRLLNLLTMQMGESEVLVAMKVEWTEKMSSDELVERINAMEKAIHEASPRVRWLFVEPDCEA